MRKTITKGVGFKLGSFLLVAFLPSLSHAQGVQRTFVSGLGNDGNPCSRTAPCRTFGQAISQTNAGGEVIVLDSAGYGPVTITQGVSITAPPGLYAGISVFSGTGVTINTGGSDTVILRGLTINNQGSTGNGISFSNQGVLRVEDCSVSGFSCGGCLGGDGLVFAPTTNNGGALLVRDSVFTGNTNGIDILGGSADIEHVRLELNGVPEGCGLRVAGGEVLVRNSLASHCFNGFAVVTTARFVDLQIENCSAVECSVGVLAQSTMFAATVRISNSTVTQNQNGLVNSGSPAVLLSRGNNTVEANFADTSGTIGTYSAK